MNQQNYMGLTLCGILAFAIMTACASAAAPTSTPTPVPPTVTLTSTQKPPTLTPRPTATMTPLASTPGLEVLAGQHYVEFGFYNLFGEVANNTENWFAFVKVNVRLYNSTGKLIATDSTDIELNLLAPKDKAPFYLLSKSGGFASSIASYELQAEGIAGSISPYPLELKPGREYIGATGDLNVTGEVINKGDSSCSVQLVGAYYDAEGQVITIKDGTTRVNPLPSFASSIFNMFDDKPEGYDHVRVWVQCEGMIFIKP